MADIKFSDNSGRAKEELAKAVERALEAAGTQTESLAKRELQKNPSRIDTGLLRNSITHAISGHPPAISSYSGDSASKYDPGGAIPSGTYSGTVPASAGSSRVVYIGTNVEYAPYVHEGTDRMAPNRFLKNAIQNNMEELKEIMKRQIER